MVVRRTCPGPPLSGLALALGGGVSEPQLSPLGTPDIALAAESLWLCAQLGWTWTRVWPGASDTALCSGVVLGLRTLLGISTLLLAASAFSPSRPC